MNDQLLKTIYPNLSGGELELVVQWCKSKNLDPLNKPCYLQFNPKKIIPTVNGYLALAHMTGQFAGAVVTGIGPDKEYTFKGKVYKAPEWCTINVKRIVGIAPGHVVADFQATPVYFEEYAGEEDHYKYPRMFLCGWALSRSLKTAFADILGGLPTTIELNSGMKFENDKPKNIDGNPSHVLQSAGSHATKSVHEELSNAITESKPSDAVDDILRGLFN